MPTTTNDLPENHPLRNASWIWPEAMFYLYNCTAQFRYDFSLKSIPKKAPFFITADKAYKLYINGEFVCRGPARGYQSHWPFDEVDVASYLTKGHNWISVEGYNPGIGTFQYIHQSQAGFICAADWGKTRIRSNDTDWVFRRAPGRITQTARYSIQLDFQEHADLSKEDRTWITSAKAPVWFKGLYPHRYAYVGNPYGRAPWDTLELRGIPLMRETVLVPQKVSAQAIGTSKDNYRTRQNASWDFIDEAQQIGAWSDGAKVIASRNDDWFTVKIAPAGKGKFNAVTIDIGTIIVGNLEVEISGAQGGEIIDFQHYQCLRDGKPAFLQKGWANWLAQANRLFLGKGKNAHEFFHILCFSHVTLIARDCSSPLIVKIRARAAEYPFSMKGRFECTDPVFTSIYESCRKSQQLCSLDAYVDTPWREQAQWWGDTRVQAKNTFYLDGDARLFARGIRSIAAQNMTSGLTFGHAPTIAYCCILPDFSLTFILTVWDYYWQTGDISLFVEMWPRIQQILAYFKSDISRDKPTGLLRWDRRYWYFGDWGTVFHDEVPTLLNLFYLLTIRRTADLLKIAKLGKDFRAMESESQEFEKLVVKVLYDPAKKMFRDGIDSKRKIAQRWSAHEQTVALMLDLVPSAHATMITERLLPFLLDKKIDGSTPSAFWSVYTLEEMGKRGYGKECLDFIKKHWEPMTSTGTTWEGFDWDEKSGSSCTHAWSAHPSFHLVNMLVGIRQTAPAWQSIEISPTFHPDIDHASGSVPSPLGLITVAWKRKGTVVDLEVTMPQQMIAVVNIAGKKQKITGGKKQRIRIDLAYE